MTPLPVRGMWVSREVHSALREYAWLKRTTMGNIIRAILDEISTAKTIDSVLGVEDIPGRTRLSVKASDDLWNEAKDAADSFGQPLQSLVRRHIIKAVREEGLL